MQPNDLPDDVALESITFLIGSVLTLDWIVSRRRVFGMMKVVCRGARFMRPMMWKSVNSGAPSFEVPGLEERAC